MTEQSADSDKAKQTESSNPSLKLDNLQIKGAYNKYDSPFMQLIAPLIATRYLWLAIEDINPLNFLKKPDPRLKRDFKPWKDPSLIGYMSRNFAAFGMGATFLSIMGLYSRNTLHDIKSLYSEAVGYELGKKPEDVSYSDVFLKSQNAALKVTRSAYTRRTAARLTTAASFFVPWQVFRDFKHGAPKYDANANAGVGAIGVYLLGEGFVREPSFFDAEQNLANTAIRHADKKGYEIIQPKNIQTLLMLQRKHLNKKYQWPAPASEEGQQEFLVASRIADLMNQTYHNAASKDNASFTIGKFNYLIGFGMLDSSQNSLGFIELANQSSDMVNVNNAAKAIHDGQDARAVFKRFGIDIASLQNGLSQKDQSIEFMEHKFTDRVKQKQTVAVAPKGPMDFASQKSDTIKSI